MSELESNADKEKDLSNTLASTKSSTDGSMILGGLQAASASLTAPSSALAPTVDLQSRQRQQQQLAALLSNPNLLALNPLLGTALAGNPLALAATGAFNPSLAAAGLNPLLGFGATGTMLQNQILQQQFIQTQMAAAASGISPSSIMGGTTLSGGVGGMASSSTPSAADFAGDPRLSQSLVSALSATSNKFIASSEQSQQNADHGSTSAAESFPVKLHRCLMEMARDDKADIASFLPHGRAFVVHSPPQFEKDIMPKYFPRMKHFASFQRQLNLYNFKRIGGNGPDRGSYCHALFWREQPELATKMKRTKIKGLFKYATKNKSSTSSPDKVLNSASQTAAPRSPESGLGGEKQSRN